MQHRQKFIATALLTCGLISSLIIVRPSHAQEQTAGIEAQTNWRIERHTVERVWAETIVELANICEQQGLSDEARETLDWYQIRDPERTYIFLPGKDAMPAIDEGLRGQWQTRLLQLRREHAERIFELARRAANEGSGTQAFRFLNEVLYYDPDHAAVREMLNHKKTDDGWRVASDRLKSKTATKQHATMNWPAKTWASVSTPHFNIASQADEATTLLLAEKLERWQAVWRQVFFEFHTRSDAVARWIGGNGKAPRPSKKYDVIFFADKEQYVAQLSSSVPGIEYSEGYYNDSMKASFIFASDNSANHDTWRHELTHQLFQESIRTQTDPFEDGHIWLGEGIAMYFESMVDYDGYVSLGGFDSRRFSSRGSGNSARDSMSRSSKSRTSVAKSFNSAPIKRGSIPKVPALRTC